MTVVTVVARTSEYMSRPPEDDGWDNGDFQAEYHGCDVFLGGADGRGALWGQDTSEFNVPFPVKAGQIVHPVIVRYSTGSTFGRTDGRTVVVGVWRTGAQAQRVVRRIESGEQSRFEIGGQTVYCGTWHGYFEALESADYERVTVQ